MALLVKEINPVEKYFVGLNIYSTRRKFVRPYAMFFAKLKKSIKNVLRLILRTMYWFYDDFVRNRLFGSKKSSDVCTQTKVVEDVFKILKNISSRNSLLRNIVYNFVCSINFGLLRGIRIYYKRVFFKFNNDLFTNYAFVY